MFCLNSELRLFYTVFVIVYIIFCAISLYYVSVCKGSYRETQSDTNFEIQLQQCNQKTALLLDMNVPYHFPGSSHRNNDLNLNLPLNVTDNTLREHCADIPPRLVGKLKVNGQTTVEDVYNQSSIESLKPGGLFIPNCIEKDSIAIIIPYRDRARHLSVLLHHLHSVLQRQQLKYAIFVVELAYPTQFNRGILANVGFLTASEVYNFTCFVIHDVDLLPANDRNLYRCSNNPVHLSVSNSKYGYKLPYEHYNGGIIGFTREQYLKINGFSNAYFGWGREDDDLHKRIMNARYKIERPDTDVGIYEELDMLDHSRDFTNPDNPMKDFLHLRAERRFKKDGVNRVLYTRLAVEFRPLFTWVYVNTSELSVMQMIYSIDPDLKSSFAKFSLT